MTQEDKSLKACQANPESRVIDDHQAKASREYVSQLQQQSASGFPEQEKKQQLAGRVPKQAGQKKHGRSAV